MGPTSAPRALSWAKTATSPPPFLLGLRLRVAARCHPKVMLPFSVWTTRSSCVGAHNRQISSQRLRFSSAQSAPASAGVSQEFSCVGLLACPSEGSKECQFLCAQYRLNLRSVASLTPKTPPGQQPINLLLAKIPDQSLIFDLGQPINIPLNKSQKESTGADEIGFLHHALQAFQDHEQRVIAGDIICRHLL